MKTKNEVLERIEHKLRLARELGSATDSEIAYGLYTLIEQHVNGWIPVSERSPDRDERVLVFYAGEIYKAHIDWQGEWHDSESGDYLIPTHWKPLPPPPENNDE